MTGVQTCALPISINNTYLLESQYNWQGICIDINEFDYSSRKCAYINENACEINYLELFKKHKAPLIIDYLSIDIDERSFDLLKLLPYQDYKFRTITIEHDKYRFGDKFRNLQRRLLTTLGYQLLCGDVIIDGYEFEDWYIHPNYVNIYNLINLICDSKSHIDIIKEFGKVINASKA